MSPKSIVRLLESYHEKFALLQASLLIISYKFLTYSDNYEKTIWYRLECIKFLNLLVHFISLHFTDSKASLLKISYKFLAYCCNYEKTYIRLGVYHISKLWSNLYRYISVKAKQVFWKFHVNFLLVRIMKKKI